MVCMAVVLVQAAVMLLLVVLLVWWVRWVLLVGQWQLEGKRKMWVNHNTHPQEAA
jgi:hypothetical protein